jgi:glycine oxidase
VIVGAGVLGLCTAFELQRRGHAVRVVDPGGPNASLVAAGMIAPAMESAVDAVSVAHARLFRAGRDLWPAFAEAAGVKLSARPSEWRGGDMDAIASRLAALGFEARLEAGRLVTDEDLQVEPMQAMGALSAHLGDAVIPGRVIGMAQEGDGWMVRLEDESLQASAVVLATGAAAAIEGSPPAAWALVEAIQPIRGQIGVVSRALAAHVVRGPGAYVAPMGEGAVIGATMEPGRRDTAPDPAAGERLMEAAWRVLGGAPEPLAIQWRGGVRGASPDGLPLAGPAPDGERLFLALAPRRNGWLLGPLVGAVVADAIEGRTSTYARALDPGRF